MHKFLYRVPDIWLGDERSYLQLADANAYLLEHPNISPQSVALFASDGDEDDDEDPVVRLMEFLADSISFKVGSVGVVEVDGPLVDDSSYFNAWFGLVSYDSITYAARRLSEDPDVTSLLYLWSTPGGSASGVETAGSAIREIGKDTPSYSFIKRQAASAGYWLAAETQKIYGGRMAEAGSIGAVIEYTSIAGMLKDRGIDRRVVRSGEYKALGHPSEPISQKALDMLQEKVSTIGGFFTQHVAARRPVSLEDESEWGQGKTFFMEEAVQLGLADSVTDLESLLGRLDQSNLGNQSQVQYSHIANSILLRGGLMAKKIEMSEEQLAALGQAPSENTDSEGTAGHESETPETEASEEETPETQANDNTPAAETEQPSEMVAFLREELRTAQRDLAAAEANLATATATAEAQAGTIGSLLAVARDAARDMQVRIGQTPSDLSASEPAQVVKFYTATKAQFEERFTSGQKSISEGGAEEIPPEVVAASLGLHPVEESA
jgi:signal peptide peptidase SppA